VPLRLYLDVVPVAGCRKRSTSACMIDAPRRTNVDNPRKAISSFPNEIRDHDGRRTLGLANTVIAHFLGRVGSPCSSYRPEAGFPAYGLFVQGQTAGGDVFRVIELAESLYNL
jgi:hypothetical protein